MHTGCYFCTVKGFSDVIIHTLLQKVNDLFFLINPSTIPHALFESTIYGHEKGAFTGADYLQKGIFELAHGGTVFLDEIGDVSPEMQLKLLGTIETRSFRRVGIGPVVNTHFQLICATNRDLLAAVDSGTFRADLYYRMSRIPIYIPPIRDYPEDIETLARNFLDLYANKHGKRTIPYDGKLKERMEKYRWPGNVRELEGYIERIVVLDDETLEIDAQDNRSSSDKKMKNAEKRSRVIDSLIKANWNKRKAALILGCCTRTVYNWMEEYEIPLKKQLGYYG